MEKNKIFEYVKDKYSEKEAKMYFTYVGELLNDPKQSWAKKKDHNYFILQYEKVKNDGLVIDGKHITLGYNGISYDYVAYKNKMLLSYPESIIDIQIVYQGDEFDFKKENGKVVYSHKITNPFANGTDKIQGGYCIIKNTRGEFITILSKKEFEAHKAVAKTQFIWNKWYKEMCMKTLFKKAIKVHYDDVFQSIEEEDNKNYELPTEEKSQEEKEINLKEKYANN